LKAVDGVTLDVTGSEIVGVVGESGCGKSTLGRCAVGLQEITGGQVFWGDRDLTAMGKVEKRQAQRSYQMVFQNPFASLDPRQKIQDILLEPMEVHRFLSPAERKEFAKDVLVQVGLRPDDLEKYPHEFSGGQRQRVGLARALVCRPELVVLDEPVSSLDVSVQASILNLLARFNQTQKVAYLFISHDLQVVGYLSDRVLVMYLGRVVEEGRVEQVLRKPRHPYTQVLLAASEGQKVSVGGEPPSPVNVPQGCAFHMRCPFAEKRCREERQELMEVEGAWKVACWKWEKL
jgi:oligopeptide/dipeptide ABC transporter ATP-binding protein